MNFILNQNLEFALQLVSAVLITIFMLQAGRYIFSYYNFLKYTNDESEFSEGNFQEEKPDSSTKDNNNADTPNFISKDEHLESNDELKKKLLKVGFKKEQTEKLLAALKKN